MAKEELKTTRVNSPLDERHFCKVKSRAGRKRYNYLESNL